MYKSNSKKKNTGFYIALAICIVTVAAAAWTTYGSVVEYYQPEEMHTGNEVSGEPYEWSEPSDEVSEPSVSSAAEESSFTPSESSVQEESSLPAENSPDASSEPAQESVEEVRTILCPIESGLVAKPFSMTKLLYAKTTNDWRTHRGTDYTAKAGSAVLSMSDGIVQSVYQDTLYGQCICIDHNGFVARYCGLTEKVLVRDGDHVTAGQPIGYIGTVPCEQTDDPHLHLELMAGADYISMEQLISK